MFSAVTRWARNALSEMRRRRVVHRAIGLSYEERHPEAARLYSEYASLLLPDSPLHYCLYSLYSFEQWLKAARPDEALVQARNALGCLSANDGELLKYDSGEFADTPMEMAAKLYGAGYVREAEEFSRELNARLEEFGVPMRCVLDPAGRKVFPSACERCGGALPASTHQDSIVCPFCRSPLYPR